MPVVADVHADFCIRSLEYRIPEIPWPEVELLPESRCHVRYVVLPVLPEVRPVGVDHCCSIVVDAGRLFLVYRHDDHHAVTLRELLHELRGRTVRNLLRRVIPSGTLLGTEIRTGENLLHAEDLNALAGRLLYERDMLGDIRLSDRLERFIGAARVRGLDEAALHYIRHSVILQLSVIG